MLYPLLRLSLTQPQLLADHADACAELVAQGNFVAKARPAEDLPSWLVDSEACRAQLAPHSVAFDALSEWSPR